MATDAGYDALMHDVCVVWGYCGCSKHGVGLHVDLFIPPAGPVTADQFVEWVILADNQNPNLNTERLKGIKAGLRQAFVRHLGAEVVDATQLQWSCVSQKDGQDPGRTES